MRQFTQGEVDAVYVVYMNFVSTGVQRPEVLTLLPLSGLRESLERISLQVAEKEAQLKRQEEERLNAENEEYQRAAEERPASSNSGGCKT